MCKPPSSQCVWLAPKFHSRTSLLLLFCTKVRREQLLRGMSPGPLAAAHRAGWTQPLALMALARRPPLLLDPHGEGGALVQALYGKGEVVYARIGEERIAEKVGEGGGQRRSVCVWGGGGTGL